MLREVLTPDEMAQVDRQCAARGPLEGYGLMRRAGNSVVAIILARYAAAEMVAVLCGPGNNGGDGYVIAEGLRRAGVVVDVFCDGVPKGGSDAAMAKRDCRVQPKPLEDFDPLPGIVVVDALFGAGLSRPVGPVVAQAMGKSLAVRCTIVAVDLPSGVSGATGAILGDAFTAELTVTFVRKKPGHLLLPGRGACGEMIVADIGVDDETVRGVGSRCFENAPAVWQGQLPTPSVDAHKYSRGNVAVFSGGPTATGAARLSAMAAARTGAGAVTILSPQSALAANAAHLTSIMLKKAETPQEAASFIADRRVAAVVYGPGLSAEVDTVNWLLELLLQLKLQPALVLDASALTSIARHRDKAFDALRTRDGEQVLTPHEGEFARLFPGLTEAAVPSKLERARAAAVRANAIVVYKGPDTVIAAPDGRAAINTNGTSWLATAGSGDVLAGIIGGLLAQKMPAFEAACAGVWIHAEAATRFGPGLIAEDLPFALLPVLRSLYARG